MMWAPVRCKCPWWRPGYCCTLNIHGNAYNTSVLGLLNQQQSDHGAHRKAIAAECAERAAMWGMEP